MASGYPQHVQQPNSWHHQGTEERPSPATLLIRRLPEAIPLDTLSRLFSHYGAVSVRPCAAGRSAFLLPRLIYIVLNLAVDNRTSLLRSSQLLYVGLPDSLGHLSNFQLIRKTLKNCAFVDFKDELAASQAQRQLNGLRFLGKMLSVEKATKPSEDNKNLGGETEKKTRRLSLQDVAQNIDHKEGSKTDCMRTAEPIAERLAIHYPFPPHLEYAYPPPDGNILTNIVNALVAVPRFYTQVLHLMNKMNIPAPFRMALPTPPLPSTPVPPPPPLPLVTDKPHQGNLSSDESEMETSEEESNDQVKPPRKRFKRDAIVGPGMDKDVSHEAVGLKPASLTPKEIPIIKKNNPVLQIRIAPKRIKPGVDDVDIAKEPGKLEQDAGCVAYATSEQIESQKLPPEDILSLPMFKNYSAGDPASVLYIKNLAKDVVPDDFYFVFGSFFGSIDAAKAGLSVKLMQEGRMRGQAFVTFPSTELAHHALNLVNGYVFKGKAMIIQFGRSSAKTS